MLGNVGYRNFPTAFSPAALFAASEPGVWFDPSDVANTLWLYNLLTWTDQFDNAAWSRTGATITANAAIAPNGTTTADRLTEDTSTGPHRVFQTVNIPATPHAFSFYAKPAGRDWVYVYANAGLQTAFINVSTGAIGSVLGSSNISVTAVGDGWYRVSLGFENVTVGSQNIQIWAASADGTINYTGNGTSGIFIWGAQLQTGSTATTYQPITTVAAETIARFPLATLYQDIAGTTPVTAPNQPVGLMLDKSQGLVLGSELRGTGAIGLTGTATAATYNTTTGAATCFRVDASNQSFVTLTGLTSTATYVVTVTCASAVVGMSVRAGAFSAAAATTLTAGQTKTAYVTGTTAITFTDSGSGCSFTVTSVKLIAGNHATQSTSGSRPTYGIVPATGRRNLLTFSEQFDNAAWVKQGIGVATAPVVTANAGIAPDGTTTADRVQMSLGGGTTAGDISTINQAYSFSAGNYTSSFWIRSNTGADQTVQLTIEGVGITVFTVTPTWQRFSGIRNATGLSSNVALRLRGTFTGNTADILVWGAQLETGSTATAYQRVVTAFEVTEANVASLSYIFFDGIDDFMVTPTITPGTDKVQVFAGVRKLSDAALAVMLELSTGAGSGRFGLFAPSAAATANYQFATLGTSATFPTATGFAAPITNVITAFSDISAPNAIVRVNGTQQAQSTSTQGTGNYLAYPLYIGRRGGTSNPFNGQMYGLITRFGANLTTTTAISRTESWLNNNTGAF